MVVKKLNECLLFALHAQSFFESSVTNVELLLIEDLCSLQWKKQRTDAAHSCSS